MGVCICRLDSLKCNQQIPHKLVMKVVILDNGYMVVQLKSGGVFLYGSHGQLVAKMKGYYDSKCSMVKIYNSGIFVVGNDKIYSISANNRFKEIIDIFPYIIIQLDSTPDENIVCNDHNNMIRIYSIDGNIISSFQGSLRFTILANNNITLYSHNDYMQMWSRNRLIKYNLKVNIEIIPLATGNFIMLNPKGITLYNSKCQAVSDVFGNFSSVISLSWTHFIASTKRQGSVLCCSHGGRVYGWMQQCISEITITLLLPKNNFIAGLSNGDIGIWSYTGKCLHIVNANNSRITALAKNKYLFSGCTNGYFRVWAISKNKLYILSETCLNSPISYIIALSNRVIVFTEESKIDYSF